MMLSQPDIAVLTKNIFDLARSISKMTHPSALANDEYFRYVCLVVQKHDYFGIFFHDLIRLPKYAIDTAVKCMEPHLLCVRGLKVDYANNMFIFHTFDAFFRGVMDILGIVLQHITQNDTVTIKRYHDMSLAIDNIDQYITTSQYDRHVEDLCANMMDSLKLSGADSQENQDALINLFKPFSISES